MDPRIREHAQIICNHSIELQNGDKVVIDAHPVAEDLVTALHEEIADASAHPLVVSERTGSRYRRAFLRNHDGDFELPEHTMALYKEMDAYIAIRSSDNVTQESDVDPSVRSEYDKAQRPLLNERLSKRWCLTQYPAPANAQLAEMSTEAYENFVWDAVNKDWKAVRAHQQQLVHILDPADEVQIVSGDTTDISLSLAGNHTVNDYGKKNLPGGEVFTAPIPHSLEGE
ncbi:MAG: aminopeptidase, partial [archaeon]